MYNYFLGTERLVIIIYQSLSREIHCSLLTNNGVPQALLHYITRVRNPSCLELLVVVVVVHAHVPQLQQFVLQAATFVHEESECLPSKTPLPLTNVGIAAP